MLGSEQREWLQQELLQSKAQWKIIGQQTMMSPLLLFNFALNMDQWDGYVAERDRLFNFVRSNDIDNMVVLTGDIHGAFASDLPLTLYNPTTGRRTAGVEFVTTSVTSSGLEVISSILGIPQDVLYFVLRLFNPHIKYMEHTRRGYSLLDLNKERAQNDFYMTGPRETLNNIEDYAASSLTKSGRNRIQKGRNGASQQLSPSQSLAPMPNITLKRRELMDENSLTDAIITGIYHEKNFSVQFFLQKTVNSLRLRIVNIISNEVCHDAHIGFYGYGLHLFKVECPSAILSPGQYSINLFSYDNVNERYTFLTQSFLNLM